MTRSAEDRRELVFAVCHEIGNLVAAIRLEAHLLDDEPGGLGLARSAISIEDLSERVGALLSQIRPLLEPAARTDRSGVDPAALLARLRDALDERGRRGVEIALASGEGLPRVVGDLERTYSLLILIVLGALEAASASGRLRVDAERRDSWVWITVADDGPEDSELVDWRQAERRGRPLVLQVAEAVLESLGGGVEVAREDGETRIDLRLPVDRA